MLHGLTGVGNQNLGVLDPLGAVDSNLLVQDETCRTGGKRRALQLLHLEAFLPYSPLLTFVEITIRQLSSNLFDDLNVIQIRASL